jgi:hypothetical protein
MKKDAARVPREHRKAKSGGSGKPAEAGAPPPAGDGLTCNEAQVEELLSEGEST